MTARLAVARLIPPAPRPARRQYPVTVTWLPDARCERCGYLVAKYGCGRACALA